MSANPQPQFGDDFFWWREKFGNATPPEYQGKFVLVYNRQILVVDDRECVCEAAVETLGLEGKHYVIMAVGLRPTREHLEMS